MTNYWPALRTGGLILASLALVPFSAGAQATSPAAATASPRNSVSRVEVAGDSTRATVRVEGSGESTDLNYQVSRLTDPPRVVVDLSGAKLAVGRNAISSTFEPVRGVRLGQYKPDEVRVVIDLLRPADYAIAKNEHGLTVTFANSGAAAQSDVSADSNAVRATATVPAKKLLAQKSRDAASASQDLPLPALLTRTDAAMARPAQDLAQRPAAEQAPQTTQAPAAQPASLSSQLPQPANQATQSYSGEPISVNLKDVDLKDFFRLIHEISGLNVVLDPTVRGSVTLVLDEVPWDQALDIVLKNNGLDKELDGNVLRIVTSDTLRREADGRRDLLKAQTDSVQPETITRVLNYAKASELVTPLKRFLTARGDIVAIDRSNTLIIRDVPDSIPAVDNLIRQLDRKTQQVEIQARVVQASRNFARDIGTQFGMSGGWSGASSSNVLGGNPVASQASPLSHPVAPPLVSVGSVANSMPLLSNFPANAATSGIVFGHSSPNFALDYIITAAESKGVGKLLSSPQLVTQNNAVADVKQGAQIPIQTTVNNTISTTYVDAVLELKVTPQITSEGTVFLDVQVQNTQADFSNEVNGTPSLNTQAAQTKVLIQDGGTVVIGGVMTTQNNTTIQQVPILGSVPVIGHLFSRTAVSVSTQELLFFLTPRILPD